MTKFWKEEKEEFVFALKREEGKKEGNEQENEGREEEMRKEGKGGGRKEARAICNCEEVTGF